MQSSYTWEGALYHFSACFLSQMSFTSAHSPGQSSLGVAQTEIWLQMAPLGHYSHWRELECRNAEASPQYASCYSAGISLGLTYTGS